MRTIQDLPHKDRPRERLATYGATALSDQELLAIVLGSGRRGRDVIALAGDVLEVLDRTPSYKLYEEIVHISGIGEAKAGVITAAMEIARRRIKPDGTKVKEPRDIVPLLAHLADRKQEHFCCVSLSGAHEIIASRVVTVGLANMCQVHPREVLADPITDRACAIIVAHNHPSGNLEPSKEDIALTQRLTEASKIIGITLLDHIVFSRRGFVSLRESGKMGA